jgi:uncharacterized protein (DUF4213/DUF364 family)
MNFLRQIKNDSPFHREEIDQLSIGSKYLAVMLKNGQIGVCATLGNPIPAEIREVKDPDLKTPWGRILFIAFANATINYQHSHLPESDIFDRISFTGYEQVVMIGFFQSLTEKFRNAAIPLHIFDIEKNDPYLSDMEKQIHYIRKPGAVIMTSTTLVNDTFDSLIGNCHPDSDIYMLGPSGILCEKFFDYPPIRFVFGSVFQKHDQRVMDVIQKGFGTKHFLPYLKKVYLKQHHHEATDI